MRFSHSGTASSSGLQVVVLAASVNSERVVIYSLALNYHGVEYPRFKRYSELRALHASLPGSLRPAFPSKGFHWWRQDLGFAVRRRRELDEYFRQLLHSQEAEIVEALRAYFQLPRYYKNVLVL